MFLADHKIYLSIKLCIFNYSEIWQMLMQKGGIFGLQIPNRVVPFVETIKFHLSSTVGCKFLGMLPISLIWASFPCVCYLSSHWCGLSLRMHKRVHYIIGTNHFGRGERKKKRNDVQRSKYPSFQVQILCHNYYTGTV